jgi:hypothetical protein
MQNNYCFVVELVDKFRKLYYNNGMEKGKRVGRPPLSQFGKSMTQSFKADPELLELIKRKRAALGKQFPGWFREHLKGGLGQ